MDQKSILRTLTISHGAVLVPYIDSYLAAAKFPEEWHITIPNTKKDDGHFHPSSDAFASPRDLYLKHKQVTSSYPINAALRKTFDCGHMWHGYVENIVEEMGFVSHEDVERKVVATLDGPHGPFTGAGTGDLVNVKIPGKGTWLVDIKTMRKDEFEAGANKFTYMKWEAQVSCYMDWFGLDQAMILAICKDSPHAFREYKITKNAQVLGEIYERWSYAAKCIAENTLPEDKYIPLDPALLNPGDSVEDAVVAEVNKLSDLK